LAIIICLPAAAVTSFWVFSRFTVDDAFLAWRYGKNLVDAGVWNYNPAAIDLTQAYTNPLYALLSTLPSALNLDVVLFFKVFSLLVVGAFCLWFYFQARASWLLLIVFLALPATMIHGFGGLETTLFVFLLAALMISMYEQDLKSSLAVTLLLFLTRPESWILVALVPTYYLIDEKSATHPFNCYRMNRHPTGISLTWQRSATALLWLGIPLSLYFVLNFIHFGNVLPNTFYAKASHHFNFTTFFTYFAFLMPLLLLAIYGRRVLLLWLVATFGIIILNYSTSNLQMNYSSRFLFHIFAPVFLFVAYLSSLQGNRVFFVSERENGPPAFLVPIRYLINAMLLLYIAVFASTSLSIREAAAIAAYYPRALDSHAAFGKLLHRISQNEGIRSFSLGDAGMAAYHSGLIALDNVGLGSAKVTERGIDPALLDEYNLDVIALHAQPDAIRLGDYHQQAILHWGKKKGFMELCDVYWSKDYTLRIFAKADIKEIHDLCESSKAKNAIPNSTYLKNILRLPPWVYWKE
jgi:hypothetical protein